MGQLGVSEGLPCPWAILPGLGDLLGFISRHVYLALQKAPKLSPLGTKHVSLREALKSFLLIDSYFHSLSIYVWRCQF